MSWTVHDETICLLGEGALWHPEREELLWLDIVGRTAFCGPRRWRLDGLPGAMGWVDRDAVLLSLGRALVRLDLGTGATEHVAEADDGDPRTRFNDGRADPFGGFWFSRMGTRAEARAGSFWRYHRGEVRRLFPNITIPNACCFAPDGSFALFADTTERVVWSVGLDEDGWPRGEPRVHLDLRADGLNPDGAVMDRDGTVWIALWGPGEVAGFRDGTRTETFSFPATQTSCPALGGPGLSTLFVTSAAVGIPQGDATDAPESGRTFAVETAIPGLPEHRVVL